MLCECDNQLEPDISEDEIQIQDGFSQCETCGSSMLSLIFHQNWEIIPWNVSTSPWGTKETHEWVFWYHYGWILKTSQVQDDPSQIVLMTTQSRCTMWFMKICKTAWARAMIKAREITFEVICTVTWKCFCTQRYACAEPLSVSPNSHCWLTILFTDLPQTSCFKEWIFHDRQGHNLECDKGLKEKSLIRITYYQRPWNWWNKYSAEGEYFKEDKDKRLV
jgi:hypothetical protein